MAKKSLSPTMAPARQERERQDPSQAEEPAKNQAIVKCAHCDALLMLSLNIPLDVRCSVCGCTEMMFQKKFLLNCVNCDHIKYVKPGEQVNVAHLCKLTGKLGATYIIK